MALTWLWKLEHALLHVLGPAQLITARDEERHRREQAARPAPPPTPEPELVPGGWVRRGNPGNHYIVRASDDA